jgi:hypothetical protein
LLRGAIFHFGRRAKGMDYSTLLSRNRIPTYNSMFKIYIAVEVKVIIITIDIIISISSYTCRMMLSVRQLLLLFNWMHGYIELP